MPEIFLLTKHHKQIAIAPVLARTGYEVRTIEGFDTDLLGSFTREIPRSGSQLDAAMAKAKLAIHLEGCRFGLGSEGSFGADPYIGCAGWGIEVLAWWDEELRYGVHAVVQGPDTNYAQTTVNSREAALDFAEKIGFPDHGLILGKPGDSYFSKEIKTKGDLLDAVGAALLNGPAWLESDMRAHRNPKRMSMISRCADALVQRLLNACPGCKNPGFGPAGLIAGATCNLCSSKTRVARARRYRCEYCGFETEELLRETTDPTHCDLCNP